MMDRGQIFLEGISKEMLGIEIGPWNNPIVPKREGYNSLALDVFDGLELRARAKRDNSIADELIERIEDVDLVGTGSDLADLVRQKGLTGKIDYIVSSHNFEHMPNPIRFLQACSEVLKPGGLLTMAVPDKRRCFDFYRPHSTVGAFLDAYFNNCDRPGLGQIFDHFSLNSCAFIENADRDSWAASVPRSDIRPRDGTAGKALSIISAKDISSGQTYVDAHCWTFTPASLKFIFNELGDIGMLPMTVDAVIGPRYHEIFIKLRNVPPVPTTVEARLETIRAVDKELIDGDDDFVEIFNRLHRQLAASEKEKESLRSELAATRRAS